MVTISMTTMIPYLELLFWFIINYRFSRLWRVNGCHELLASLGFDLAEVGQDEVTLRTGKTANRRHIQFVLQALLALFGTFIC